MSGYRAGTESNQLGAEVFHAVAELSPDIVSVVGPDGTLLYNSRAAERIHGYTQAEMIGRNTMELIHPDDRPEVERTLAELLSHPGGVVNVQYRYRNKDGSFCWMEAVASNELQNPEVRGVITISRDISRRKRLEQELREAVAARDEFISIASHDLRSPLTALTLELQTAARLCQLPELAGSHLGALIGRALKNAGRLGMMIGNLLDASRIRAGRLLLNRSTTQLGDVVHHVLSSMTEEIAASGSTVRLRVDEDARGKWDPTCIERVVTNLLSNALKYGAGRPIDVRVGGDRRTGCALLTVRDEGVGIAEDMRERIFDPFERVAPEGRTAGLGLGLYIVRQIVLAHGGTVRVESTPGAGSLFAVELPTASLEPATEPLPAPEPGP